MSGTGEYRGKDQEREDVSVSTILAKKRDREEKDDRIDQVTKIDSKYVITMRTIIEPRCIKGTGCLRMYDE